MIILHSEPPVSRFVTRRKSVFAETYDPEEDEEDEGVKVKLFYLLDYYFIINIS